MTQLAPADLAPAPRAAGMPLAAPERPPEDLRPLKWMLWGYLALWVGEGALRKWILPGLASPLLVVRDPILLLMYATAMAKGVFPRHAFVAWITGIGVLALSLSLIGSNAPLFVQAYGFRADFLHLPLVFLIPNLFDRDDLRRVGRWTLLVALPMAFLVLLQFRSGTGGWLNVGVGGEGTMLDAAYGHIRPSGTFSFGNGLGNFTALVAAFCVYGLLQKNAFPRLLVLASLPALAILILLSGSRSAVGLVAVVLGTVLLVSLLKPRYLGPAMKIIGVCLLAAVAVGSFAVFRDGMDIFAYRFGSATEVREGFFDRFFGSFLAPFQIYDKVEFYGVGLGMGTNVGAGLLLGRRKFLYSENELGRVMLESGPVVGAIYLLLRVAIVVFLFGHAVRTLRRDGHPLAMLLLGACSVEMLLGQFGQATTLGYVTIACGLCLAANRAGTSESAEAIALPPQRANPLPSLPPARARASAFPGRAEVRRETDPPERRPAAAAAAGGTPPRGRSAYAERMHAEAQDEVRSQSRVHETSPGTGDNAEGRSPNGETETPT